MSRALAIAALALAGCHGDVCSSGGSCIDLTVASDGTVAQVDQLELRVYGAASFGPGRTTRLGNPVPFPVTSDIAIPDGRTGSVTVSVVALANGAVVGEGAHGVNILPGARARVTVTVTAKQPRHVFLLAPRNGRLGDRATVDKACGDAAAGAELQGNFVALLGYASIPGSPASYVSLTGGDRQVVRSDGLLVATDATFFQADHVEPIDTGPSGEPATSDCVWTNFTPNGVAPKGGADCAGWMDDMLLRGNYGEPQQSNVNWCNFGDNQTCDALCHVYCLEQ